MNKLRIILFPVLCYIGCAITHAAFAADLVKIIGNMGGIGLDGLPKLSLDIVDRQDAGELAALGFGFQLTHQTRLWQEKTAKTEWDLPSPRTYAYIDRQSNVIWLTPSGQTVQFSKKERGYDSDDDGVTVRVSPDGNVIEIITQAAIKWRYQNGFLENISNRVGYYSVITDRETILSISKKILNREVFLLKCAYSKQGDLEGLEFGGGRKYRMLWSTDHDLLAVDGPEGRRFEFEYVNSLLTCWTMAKGPRNELKWQHLDYVRETAFQIPPVLLRGDTHHSYVYKLTNWGGVEIAKTYDKNGTLMSETKIGRTSVEQITKSETIKYEFD